MDNIRPKVAVTGSRHYADLETVKDALWYVYELVGPFHLLVGDAQGADELARSTSPDEFTTVFYADWRSNGKAAGPLRNREMLDAGAQYLIAFVEPCTCSKYVGTHATHGTQDCINAAHERGIPVLVAAPEGVVLTPQVAFKGEN